MALSLLAVLLVLEYTGYNESKRKAGEQTVPEHNNQMNAFFCLEDDLSSVENFLDLGLHKHYQKGEVILSIGEPVTHFYYLKQGKAGRLITAANGVEKYIKVVCDQGIIGEVVFFQNRINAHPFIAIEDCDCYLFDKQTVDQVLLTNTLFVKQLIQWFCRRMSALNGQVTDSLIKSPHYRICKFLLEYVQEFGSIDEKGCYIYRGKLSHYDIAKYLGINRVSVTNVLKQLQEEGIIHKERQLLILLNVNYLQEL